MNTRNAEGVTHPPSAKQSKGALRISKEKTALVMAPHPAWRPGLRRMLHTLGYARVLEAGTEPEGISLLRGELVDLVLTPWETPGVSGATVVKASRGRGRQRKVPVVVLDDGLSPAAVVAAVKAGIAGRIQPQGGISELRKILNEIGEPPFQPPPQGGNPDGTGPKRAKR